MNDEVIQIVTTTAEKADAQRLAQMLVDRRLAACTQISGPIESGYWWNSRIESAREWHVTAKTLRSRWAEAQRAIAEHHPYETPEIMALAVVEISDAYRAWLVEQVSPNRAASES